MSDDISTVNVLKNYINELLVETSKDRLALFTLLELLTIYIDADANGERISEEESYKHLIILSDINMRFNIQSQNDIRLLASYYGERLANQDLLLAEPLGEVQ